MDRDNEAEARMKIQDIINELHGNLLSKALLLVIVLMKSVISDERLSLIDPKSICVDDKMKKLDQLFEQCGFLLCMFLVLVISKFEVNRF